MRTATFLLVTCVLGVSSASAQAVDYGTQPTPPTLAEVRAGMGIPSAGDVRGQRDTVGFASTPEQMARVWELSSAPPDPDTFGTEVAAGVAGVICPHDDYIYAGRVYRRVLPLVTARTVVLVGVFHRYRSFGAHDQLIFDTYRAWRSPDGEIPVSPLRDELLAALPEGMAVASAAMHDAEHSLEALAYWLRHANPAVEIVPIIVPAASFGRFQELADALSTALTTAMQARHWRLGRDLAVAISADAVHYGPDFNHSPFGEGGVDAYVRACERDRGILSHVLAGKLSDERVRTFFTTCVDPDDPGSYRLTWCGRFSIPFGLMLTSRLASRTGAGTAMGVPVAYATSVGWPELDVRDTGLGDTAPANLYHFVGQPGLAITTAR